MIFYPNKHHRPVWLPDRRSIRLKGYDYSQPGTYFVTICAQNRDCIFGDIIDGKSQLNPAGNMIHNWWNRISQKYPNVELDEYMIMPNHVHGIIIVGADPRVCLDHKKGEHVDSPLQKHVSLSHMIQWFKTMTTNEYIRNIKQNDWHPFKKRLWQRNYYEHIVRNEIELNRIRKYIVENPLKWELDEDNPKNVESN